MAPYNPCPEGYELRGGVCVPLSNFAIKRFKSQKRQGSYQPPEPEPEP